MTWLDRIEYPFAEKYFRINGHKLHYIDEGAGPVLLFIHGTPSWSFDFRNVIKLLRTNFRCIAVDHIGFGLSDKPADYNYSVQNHSETLEAFVRHLNLEKVMLVLHDFGGPIGFSFANNNPDLIDGFVVFNSWLWSTEGDPNFRKLQRILKSPLLPFLYLYLNLSARFLMPASFGAKKLTERIRRQFTSPFLSGKHSRYGTLAFARSLLNDQQWFELIWKQSVVFSQAPCLFVWGMADKYLTPDYLEKFKNRFANHQVKTIASAGHFPQEEAPEESASAIRAFYKALVENNGTISINKDPIIEHELK